MGTLERMAEKLAEDTMKVQKELDNERLFVEVGNILAASSQSLEEAYLTEMRVRMAEEKARKFLVTRIKSARAEKAADAISANE
ncbi:MAG: hypothetical protein ACU0A6_08805 [Shimia sp.]|jgi:hypothetical protein|uniref:hypothetical protein n=1 Tax=Shimia sp. TaxID=1954381 RepID=UPI004058835B